MNILYVSNVISTTNVSNIHNNSDHKILQSIQKFNQLLLEGFTENNSKITALSSIPLKLSLIKDLKISRREVVNNIQYIYTKKTYNKYFNVFITFLSSFYETIKWGVKNKSENSIIICDVLTTSVTFGALLASKVLRMKNLGIITDIPNMGLKDEKKNIYSKLSLFLKNKYINDFDLYILLTEQNE